ncbi:MAG: TldD/PmbA family protein [bacterium]|nr:TldD/PmbA family protein [bacterium]
MMDPSHWPREILERTMQHGVDHAEVYLLLSTATTVEVKRQKVDAFVSASSLGAGVRVYHEGRLGFSFTALSDGSEIDAVVRNAVEGARFTEPDRGNVPAATPTPSKEELEIFDPGLAEVTEEEKIARAMALEKKALNTDSRIEVVRKASYSDTNYVVSICNSEGLDASYRGTSCSSSIMLRAGDGTNREMGWDSDGKRFYSELDVESIGVQAARNALEQLGARKLPTVKAPVLFTPLSAVNFLEVMISAFSADSVQKGKSLFQDKVGEKVASSIVTLVDDGLMPRGLGSAPMDDEGVPMGRKSLIEAGVLQGFLHNSYTAAREGVASTGNGVRSGYTTTPHVGPTNLYVERGDRSREQLLQDMGRGLEVREIMGMHTANPISGDFSVGVSGVWVENGKPSHPVRGGAIAGNFVDLLERIEGIGNDLRFYGAVGSPSLLIGNLSISGE